MLFKEFSCHIWHSADVVGSEYLQAENVYRFLTLIYFEYCSTEEVGMGRIRRIIRDKYAEQSTAERHHCFARLNFATPTLRAAQTCFVIWLIWLKNILVQIYSLYI